MWGGLLIRNPNKIRVSKAPYFIYWEGNARIRLRFILD